MLRRLTMAAAWASIAVIAYVTLSRVHVVYDIYRTVAPVMAHPSVAHYVHFEHVAAYAVVGALFMLAYPNRLVFVCCAVFGAAGLLEFLQTWTPDRHGTLHDAAEKIAGGFEGIVLTYASFLLFARFKRSKAGEAAFQCPGTSAQSSPGSKHGLRASDRGCFRVGGY